MVQNPGSGSLGGRPAREVSVQKMPISVHAVAMRATQGITDEVTVVYTDGACRGNPGPGGWGWVVDGERSGTRSDASGSGGEPHTTNQRMEIMAVVEALRSIEGTIHVVSDSTYVVNCFRQKWWVGWKRKGWRNSQGKPVANRDLWEMLFALALDGDRRVTFEWVKGHSGDRMNDLVDQLAADAAALQ